MATKLRISGTIGSYVSEIEKWKIDHDEANACVEFEQLLALGNSSFETISRWDTIWHQKVNEGTILFDAAHERDILNLYKLWLVPSTYMLEEISRHEHKGYEVVCAEAFRRNCEDAAGLTTADDEFFGEELIAFQEEALAAHRRGETVEFEEMGDYRNRRAEPFREMFVALPEEIKAAAKAAYRQFVLNPDEPSLRRHELKKTHRGRHREGSISVSVNLRYRAIYLVDGDTNVWYWIGSHSDYNRFTGRK